MKEYHFGDLQVEIDEEVTRNYYAHAPISKCISQFDRDFVELAKRRLLPGDVLTLLDKLSIPPEKATYLEGWDLPDDTGYWSVEYRIAGRILNELEPIELWLPPKRKGFKKIAAPFGLALGALLGRKPALEKVLVSGTFEGKLEGGTNMLCEAVTAETDFPGPCFDLIFLIGVPKGLDGPVIGY